MPKRGLMYVPIPTRIKRSRKNASTTGNKRMRGMVTLKFYGGELYPIGLPGTNVQSETFVYSFSYNPTDKD